MRADLPCLAQAALVLPISSLLWISQKGQRLSLVHTSTIPLSLEQQKHPACFTSLPFAFYNAMPSYIHTQQSQIQQQSSLQDASPPSFLSRSRCRWGWGGQGWLALCQNDSAASGAAAPSPPVGDRQSIGDSRGSETWRRLSSQPVLLGRPYGGSTSAAEMLAGEGGRWVCAQYVFQCGALCSAYT